MRGESAVADARATKADNDVATATRQIGARDADLARLAKAEATKEAEGASTQARIEATEGSRVAQSGRVDARAADTASRAAAKEEYEVYGGGGGQGGDDLAGPL